MCYHCLGRLKVRGINGRCEGVNKFRPEYVNEWILSKSKILKSTDHCSSYNHNILPQCLQKLRSEEALVSLGVSLLRTALYTLRKFMLG